MRDEYGVKLGVVMIVVALFAILFIFLDKKLEERYTPEPQVEIKMLYPLYGMDFINDEWVVTFEGSELPPHDFPYEVIKHEDLGRISIRLPKNIPSIMYTTDVTISSNVSWVNIFSTFCRQTL